VRLLDRADVRLLQVKAKKKPKSEPVA
jgi:hypothetical protein